MNIVTPGSGRYNHQFMPETVSLASSVAIIVPAYNCARYLPAALESVLSQTYRDWSCFVIDDGSADETQAVVAPYVERGVVYLRQHQAGAAAARNHGIRASSSAYLAFLDADDVWFPTKLEQQIKLLESRPEVGLVCSDFSISGGPTPTSSYFERIGTPVGGHVFGRLLRNCPVCTSTVVIRRQCLADVGVFYEPLTVAEDYNLFLRIASRWDVAFLPEVLVAKQVRNENLSSTTSIDQKLTNGIAALEHVMSSCPAISQLERSQTERALADRYYDYGSYLLLGGARSSARNEFAAALRLRPTHWRAGTKFAGSFLPTNSFRYMLRLLRRPTSATHRPK